MPAIFAVKITVALPAPKPLDLSFDIRRALAKHGGAVAMKLLLPVFLLSSTVLFAQTPKAKPAVPAKPAAAKAAVPAQPAKPKDGTAKPKALITSDLNGRELAFVASALDLSKALNYLATAADRTTNPDLKGFGQELMKSLREQGVVLDAIAEMRKVKPPEGASSTQKRWSEKLEKLQGPRFEKTLLDAFIDTDRQLIAVYESGAKSPDDSIRNLVEQSLPPARQHLELLESMAGIGSRSRSTTPKAAPKPSLPPIAETQVPAAPTPVPTPATVTPTPSAPPVTPAPAAPAITPTPTTPPSPTPPPPVPKKPVFRTKIPLPDGQL